MLKIIILFLILTGSLFADTAEIGTDSPMKIHISNARYQVFYSHNSSKVSNVYPKGTNNDGDSGPILYLDGAVYGYDVTGGSIGSLSGGGGSDWEQLSQVSTSSTIIDTINLGNDIYIQQRTIYEEGKSYFWIYYTIANLGTETFNDVKFILALDAYTNNDDNGNGENVDSVKLVGDIESGLRQSLSGYFMNNNTSVSDVKYYENRYNTVWDKVKDFSFDNTIRTDNIDSGFGLQAQKATALAPGETWKFKVLWQITPDSVEKDCLFKDEDNDGVVNVEDNYDCFNQIDTDGDGNYDNQDTDSDNDGIPDTSDNCRLIVNPNQEDTDNDGVGDVCDNCINKANYEQFDADDDGIGDLCEDINNNGSLDDDDTDGDGIPDYLDNDDDGDGELTRTDCSYLDNTVYHGAPEICDAKDNNCDSFIDEGNTCNNCETKVYNGHTYLFCDELKDWNEAKTICNSYGYTMVSIENNEENSWIVSMLQTLFNERTSWIGYTDEAQEGIWSWSNNSTGIFENWHSGEPNNAGTENCAHIWENQNADWNDINCNNNYRYICELGAEFTSCQSGDMDHDGYCNDTDPDIDGDNVNNGEDSDPNNPNICSDTDNDTCDDCVSGQYDPLNDGTDTNNDGICDAGDECTPDPCHNGSACTDGDNSYNCDCTGTGFTGTNCDEDIDECADASLNNCDSNATCNNTEGSFTCTCNTGYAGNGVNCINITTDTDNDGILDYNTDGTPLDNCINIANNDQKDTDEDGMGDACDDSDNDGINDDKDNCMNIFNPEQSNIDLDDKGDVCDDDIDGDTILNDDDNCKYTANTDQADSDNDNIGDVCDSDNGVVDTDGDGINDFDENGAPLDNCVNVPNHDQLDTDNDETGDACDDDIDGDSVLNTDDNCISVSNADQLDDDNDGIGNTCDDVTDTDGDGVEDDNDNCPLVPNADQLNSDDDSFGNLCDSDDDNDGVEDSNDSDPLDNHVCSDTDNDTCDDCVNGHYAPDNDGLDTDSDGLCNAGDEDDDNDGVNDNKDDGTPLDNCPLVANADQTDTDNDGTGDACEDDKDGDTVKDSDDNCPLVSNTDQANHDEDEMGDACDEDDDNDGVNDNNNDGTPLDNCPFTANRDQTDTDDDGIGDVCDDKDDSVINPDDLKYRGSSVTGCDYGNNTSNGAFLLVMFMLIILTLKKLKKTNKN